MCVGFGIEFCLDAICVRNKDGITRYYSSPHTPFGFLTWGWKDAASFSKTGFKPWVEASFKASFFPCRIYSTGPQKLNARNVSHGRTWSSLRKPFLENGTRYSRYESEYIGTEVGDIRRMIGCMISSRRRNPSHLRGVIGSNQFARRYRLLFLSSLRSRWSIHICRDQNEEFLILVPINTEHRCNIV